MFFGKLSNLCDKTLSFYYISCMRVVIVLLFLLAAYASAQGKKTVAIGVFGDEGAKFKAIKPLKQKFESTLSKEGKFKVTDNSTAILKLMRKDFEYEPGTMLSDDDARQIGELFKVQYLCVLESSNSGEGDFWLNANLVNVAAEEASVAASVQSKLLNQQDVNRAVDDLVSQLLKRSGGVFIDSRYRMNQLSQEFLRVLKKRITFKEGPCSANSMVVQIDTGEWNCEGKQNLMSCSIDVSLDGSGCTNEAQMHLRGTVRATDKNEKAAMDAAKRELINGKPDFIRDWVEELKPWTGME
jgi:hypothetical protein